MPTSNHDPSGDATLAIASCVGLRARRLSRTIVDDARVYFLAA
jgi:hypothetical protein